MFLIIVLFSFLIILGGRHSSSALDGSYRGRAKSYCIKVRIVDKGICRESVKSVVSGVVIAAVFYNEIATKKRKDIQKSDRQTDT